MRNAIRVLAVMMLLITSPVIGEDVRSAIESRNKEWTDAFNRGDLEAVSAMYDRGSLVIPGGGEAVLSRAAFEQMLLSMKQTTKDLRFETLSLDVMENYAYELGRSHFVVLADDGSETTASDRYLVIWKRAENGVWYYHLDVWWTEGNS